MSNTTVQAIITLNSHCSNGGIHTPKWVNKQPVFQYDEGTLANIFTVIDITHIFDIKDFDVPNRYYYSEYNFAYITLVPPDY